MLVLNKLDLPSVALFSFLMIFVISLILSLPFVFIIIAVVNFMSEAGLPPLTYEDIFPAFGWAYIIGISLLYAVIGTIINVLIALIYNLLSKKFGGIKVSLKKIVAAPVTNE